MNGIWRYILNVLTLLSLALCATTVGLWARSHQMHDSWAWSNSGYIQLHSVTGRIELYWGIPNPGNKPPISSISFIWAGLHEFWDDIHLPVAQFPAYGLEPNMTIHWNLWGFISAEHEFQKVNQSPLYHFLAIPYWSLFLVESCIAAAFILITRKSWRAARLKTLGHCPCCGYDLRATPDRCPECGTAPKRNGNELKEQKGSLVTRD